MKVLIVVIALLVLLLYLPVGVDVDYAGGQLSAGVRVGPKVFWLFPMRRDKAHKRKKKADTKQEAEAPREKKRRGLNFNWDEIKAALDLVVRGVKKLRFRLHRLKLRFISGGPDPYNVVMAYGCANTAASALGLYRLKHAEVDISLDFAAEAPVLEGYLSVTIRIYYLCKFGVFMAFGFLRLLMAHRKRLKQERRTAALIAGKEG